MRKLLEWVLEEEEVDDFPEEVIKEIISSANGSPGEALVLLDEVIDLQPDDMKEMITRIEKKRTQIINLIHAILQGQSWDKVRKILKGLEGESEEKVRRAILTYISSVALDDDKAAGLFSIYEAFRDPFYNNGRAGLVFACLEAVRE